MSPETSRFRELQGMSSIFMVTASKLIKFESLVVSIRSIRSPKPPPKNYITKESLGKGGKPLIY